MRESVDPNRILDYVMNSNHAVSDLDLFAEFRLTLDDILPVLENSCHRIFYQRTSDNWYLFSPDKIDHHWEPLLRLSTKFQEDDGGSDAAGMRDMKGDCVIRALAIVAHNMDESEHEPKTPPEPAPYRRVYHELSKIVADIAVAEFQYKVKSGNGISESIYGRWLEDRGWTRLDVKDNGGPPTVREFINEKNPDAHKPVMVLSTQRKEGHHLVAVVDGVILDMANCSDDLVSEAWIKVT